MAADAGAADGFGRVVGHPDLLVTALSEEHAVIRIPARSRWRIGDRLELIPNHACPIPNLFDELVGARQGRPVRPIRIDARGHSR